MGGPFSGGAPFGGVLVEYANPGSPGRTLRLLLRAVRHNLAGRGARIRSYSTGLWRLDGRPLLAAWATLYELLEAGRIRPVIAGRIPLSEAARAHTLLEGGDAIGTLRAVPLGSRQLFFLLKL